MTILGRAFFWSTKRLGAFFWPLRKRVTSHLGHVFILALKEKNPPPKKFGQSLDLFFGQSTRSEVSFKGTPPKGCPPVIREVIMLGWGHWLGCVSLLVSLAGHSASGYEERATETSGGHGSCFLFLVLLFVFWVLFICSRGLPPPKKNNNFSKVFCNHTKGCEGSLFWWFLRGIKVRT